MPRFFFLPPAGPSAVRSIYELTTEEAYRLLADRWGHALPPLEAVENEDWGRDYLLQHFTLLTADELAGLGLHLGDEPPSP